MERWRRERVLVRPWVRYLTPPTIPLGTPQVAVLRGHTDIVECLALSPGARTVAAGGWDRAARFWDLATGRGMLALGGHRDYVSCIAFSPDGQNVATGDADGNVWVWRVVDGELLASIETGYGGVHDVIFVGDGFHLVTVGADGRARVWLWEMGQEVRLASPDMGHIARVMRWDDDQQVLLLGFGVSATVWDLCRQCVIRQASAAEATEHVLAVSPDGERAVKLRKLLEPVGCGLWDGGECVTLKGHEQPVRCATFSPDGHWIATGSEDTTVRVWESATGREHHCWHGHTGGITALLFTPDGNRVLSASGDATVRIWNVHAVDHMLQRRGYHDRLIDFEMSASGRTIVCATDHGAVRVLDAESGEDIANTPGGLMLSAVACSPDGSRIAYGTSYMETRVRLMVISCDVTLADHTFGYCGRVEDLYFVAEGRRLVAKFEDGRVVILDATEGHRIGILFPQQHDWRENMPVTTPEGPRSIGVAPDGSLVIHDASTGVLVESIARPPHPSLTHPDETGHRYALVPIDAGMVVVDVEAERAITCGPEPVQCIQAHPKDVMWIGIEGSHLCFMRLEDAHAS
jgi:WD40 repeat protein